MKVKKYKHLLVVGVLLYMTAALLLPSTVSAQAVTVSIDAPDEVGLGASFVARVNITNVTNFDACNYDITYDPSILEVTGVTDGLIGSTTIPIEMWGEVVSGRTRVIENVPGVSGVSGSGYLAEVHFHVIGAYGSASDIDFTDGTLSDGSANEIAADWVGDSVSIHAALSADFSASPLEGVAGFTQFTFTDATTGDAPPYSYRWDFDNNGTADSTIANPTHIYASVGTYTVSLTVTGGSLEGPTDTETKAGYITVYKQGDANKDGDVNSLDITKTERIIVLLDGQTPGADANCDSNINSLDITQIELIIING